MKFSIGSLASVLLAALLLFFAKSGAYAAPSGAGCPPASGATARADGGAPPVLPEVTAADAAFPQPDRAAAASPCTARVAVAPVSYTGYFELSAPTWNNRLGYISAWQDAKIQGQVKINHLFGSLPVAAVVGGEHSLGATAQNRFLTRDDVSAGIEVPLSSGTCFFSNYTRDFRYNADEVWCGLRVGFKG